MTGPKYQQIGVRFTPQGQYAMNQNSYNLRIKRNSYQRPPPMRLDFDNSYNYYPSYPTLNKIRSSIPPCYQTPYYNQNYPPHMNRVYYPINPHPYNVLQNAMNFDNYSNNIVIIDKVSKVVPAKWFVETKPIHDFKVPKEQTSVLIDYKVTKYQTNTRLMTSIDQKMPKLQTRVTQIVNKVTNQEMSVFNNSKVPKLQTSVTSIDYKVPNHKTSVIKTSINKSVNQCTKNCPKYQKPQNKVKPISKGYSPPILPIPTFLEVLNRFEIHDVAYYTSLIK